MSAENAGCRWWLKMVLLWMSDLIWKSRDTMRCNGIQRGISKIPWALGISGVFLRYCVFMYMFNIVSVIWWYEHTGTPFSPRCQTPVSRCVMHESRQICYIYIYTCICICICVAPKPSSSLIATHGIWLLVFLSMFRIYILPIYVYIYMCVYINMYIWVWVKIRYPNNWMVNTKLD